MKNPKTCKINLKISHLFNKFAFSFWRAVSGLNIRTAYSTAGRNLENEMSS